MDSCLLHTMQVKQLRWKTLLRALRTRSLGEMPCAQPAHLVPKRLWIQGACHCEVGEMGPVSKSSSVLTSSHPLWLPRHLYSHICHRRSLILVSLVRAGLGPGGPAFSVLIQALGGPCLEELNMQP